MSVAIPVQSPLSRGKRLFEGEDVSFTEADSTRQHHFQQKRARRSPSLRCGLQQHADGVPAHAQAYDAFHQLLALFPGMDEKVVHSVLVECGNSIDAAIKRLTDLRLSTDDATVAAATAAAEASGHAASPSPADSSSTGAQQQPGSSGAAAAASTAPPASEPHEPQTADDWVSYLVSEMLVCKDMADARSRAAVVLQRFEHFAKKRHKHESDARVAELLRENQIFKRAVQIQNSKLQAAKASHEEELAQMQGMLGQYQEKMKQLELANYSLAMHLQQATASSSMPHHRPPDVY